MTAQDEARVERVTEALHTALHAHNADEDGDFMSFMARAAIAALSAPDECVACESQGEPCIYCDPARPDDETSGGATPGPVKTGSGISGADGEDPSGSDLAGQAPPVDLSARSDEVTVARADLWLLLDGTDILAPEASADQVEAAVARLRATLNASTDAARSAGETGDTE